MTQTKTSKRALLTSALSLLLCCTMLIGTTWAWFTDSVTSAGNKIQSGTLQVDLLVKGGNTDYTEYTSVKTDNKPIFNYDLWEPGYTLVTNAKVVNNGTLALKYTLKFVSADNIASQKLAEVIDVYYSPSEVTVASRDDIASLNYLGTLKDVFTQGEAVVMNDNLEPKGKENCEDFATIVLKMKEEAGNEYQNQTISTFDIQLLATQWTYENDTFDNLYDDGLTPAIDGTVVEKDGIQYIYTDDGKVILYKVTENYQGNTVNVPEGVTNIGDYAFAYNNNVENVVLSSTVRDLGRGFDSSAVKSVTLNEGLEKISPRAFRKTPNLESIIIPSTVTEIETNAFQSSGIKEIYIPENVMKIGSSAFIHCDNMEKITIAGDAVEIGTYVARPALALREVHILGENVTFEPGSMTFTNYENGKASDITFYVQNETVKERLIAASGSSVSYGLNIKLPATVSVGGVNMPVTHTFADSLTYNAGGQLKTAALASADDFVALSAMMKNEKIANLDGAAANITLSSDIDLAGVEIQPLSASQGVFDGQGHTIKNLNAVQGDLTVSGGAMPGGKSGLFSYAGGMKIRNLTLENVTVNGCQAGAFAGQAEDCTLENCTLTGNVNITWSECTCRDEDWNAVGAIIGWTTNGTTLTNVKIADNTSITIVKDGMAEKNCADANSLQGTQNFVGGGANPDTKASSVIVGTDVTVNGVAVTATP